MRIGFIVTRFPSISQTFILNQITGLLDRGHDVTIYAQADQAEPFVHADVEKYGLLDRTVYYDDSYKALPTHRVSRILGTASIVLTGLRTQPRSLLKSLNVLRFGRQAASPYSWCRVTAFIDGGIHDCDIVHCHFGPNGNLGAWLKHLEVIKGKIVSTFHGYDISKYVRDHGKDVYDLLFQMGDLFLPISERWKRSLIELGCDERKIAVHSMGVDTAMFSLNQRPPRNDDQVSVLSIARLVEKKGIQDGIRAVAKVVRKHPHIQYQIAGDGPLRRDLENLVDTLDLQGHVQFLGWKRHEEIPELMRDGDILLAPSVTSKMGDEEGIPVAIMEALAQGLPVLSTRHSGIPELVQDGKFGFLVPEGDVAALADKLEYLVAHPKRWSKMGRAGREFVIVRHDINKLNDRLVSLYRRLLDEGIPPISVQAEPANNSLAATEVD
jgi:colanic acid/amylovoran biosynthesis glycosyltransferase